MTHNEGGPVRTLAACSGPQSNLLRSYNYMINWCTFNEPQSDSLIKSTMAAVNCWFPGSH